jgi:hypothetical protein
MNFYQSLQSNTAVPTLLDDRGFSYPIVGKETPANLGRLERSMQDIVEPVIQVPGPSKRREPLVEVASPYQVEAHREDTSDIMGRSSKQAASHSLLEHSDSETDASVSQESRGTSVVAVARSSPGSPTQTSVSHHTCCGTPHKWPCSTRAAESSRGPSCSSG